MPMKSVRESIKKFQDSQQKLADKYNCKISIEFEGKETVIAEPKESKNE